MRGYRFDETRARYQMRTGVDRYQGSDLFSFWIHSGATGAHDVSLGGMQNRGARVGKELGLPVAAKNDSQEICFVPNGDYAAFINAYFASRASLRRSTEGEIVDTGGRVVGRTRRNPSFHGGSAPRACGIAAGEPLYVISTEPASQRVYVGADSDLKKSRLIAGGVNWLSIAPIDAPRRSQVKIRNKHAPADATLRAHGEPDSRRGSLR